MGVHMVNTGLLDAEIDALSPEALVYSNTWRCRCRLYSVQLHYC